MSEGVCAQIHMIHRSVRYGAEFLDQLADNKKPDAFA